MADWDAFWSFCYWKTNCLLDIMYRRTDSNKRAKTLANNVSKENL